MRRLPRPGLPVEVALVGAVALLLLGIYFFGPWLTGERGIVAATPVAFPSGEPAVIDFDGGEEACLSDVGVPSEAGRGVVGVRTAGARLEATIAGPGYRATAPVRPAGDGLATFDFQPPPRDVIARVCLRNDGRRAVVLTATGEIRGVSGQSATTVEGRPHPADVSLRLEEPEPQSVLAHASDGFERLALWKPGIVGVPLLWLVALLVAFAVPALVLWSLASALRSGTDV